ncbi:MAG: PAS domain S-box protein, partial [Bulleidia sp.]
DFLKEIGCEQIQGYFYGKPMPGQKVLEQLSQNHLQLESRLEISVYNKAGLIDLPSEDSAYLFLVENETIRLLAYNGSLQKEVASAGAAKALDLSRVMSEEKTPRHRHMVRFLKGVFDHSPNTESFIENGAVFRIQASFVAGVRDFWIGKAHLTNLSSEEMSVLQKDDQMRYAMLLFDGVYHLNLEKDQIEVAACVHSQVKLGTVYPGIRSSFLQYCQSMVHLQDQKRFLMFIDADHILEEAKNTECGYVQDYFRILRDDGNYRWTLFIAMPVKHEEYESVLLYERKAVFEDYPDLQRLLEEVASSLEPEVYSENVPDGNLSLQAGLLQAFSSRSGVPLYYKNLEGRFLGVNDEMLRYLGKETEDEVIGRTLQELGILVDAEEYRQVEKRILEHGETIHYHLTLAVSGESRMLPLTVFPWYHGNQISGTAGFVHLGEMKQEESFMRDEMSGMLNAYGALLASSAYDAAYRNSGQEYEVIYLSLHDAVRISRTYGTDFFEKAVRATADLIRSAELPNGTSAAYLTGCRFVLIGQQTDSQALIDAAEIVRKKLQEIDEIDGISCHFSLDISIAYGSEASGAAALMRLLEERADQDNQNLDEIKAADELRRSLIFSPQLLETSSQRIMVVDTESLDLLFVNKALKRDLHLP